MKLVTVSEMIAMEKDADAAGLTYEQMMENAGRGLAEVIEDMQFVGDVRTILGLVGPGNNGGDTLIALSLLASSGWDATAYLVKRDPDPLVQRLEKAGGKIVRSAQDQGLASLSSLIASSMIVLDGLLGTGARPPLRDDMAFVLAEVNRRLDELDRPPYVIAVDCPSGVDCDSGEAPNECLAADLTVTMAAVKQGLLRMPAYELAGELRVVDIGLPPDLPALRSLDTAVAEDRMIVSILPHRPPLSHKGTFGTAVVAAGSVNYTGAALLAGGAAYRVGAGLVTLAVPAVIHGSLAAAIPEATWLLLPNEIGVISRDAAEVLLANLGSADALLVGPGLGTENTTHEFLSRLLAGGMNAPKPTGPMGFIGVKGTAQHDTALRLPGLVVDADGLKLLARLPDWQRLMPAPAVLTPHPGEMSILTGLSKDEIQADRLAIASRFARTWGHVVVLKGAFTVIANPEGQTCVIPVASAALARAGTGDVLAGAIVGLRAQGVAPYEAAIAGAWIHAQAGLEAAKRIGNAASVLAGDVLDSIATVISGLPGT